MKIINCKVDHLINPIGYRIEKPVFSYVVTDAEGKRQTRARIRVSTTEDMSALIYDTDWSDAINSLAHEADITLSPRTRYYWTVTAQTDKGEETTSSVNWFETGKQGEDWQAKWITCDSTVDCHPVFSREIQLSKPLEQARLYICGLGLYEARINGARVSDERLTPYCNNYNTWLQYQTYDVTSQVKDGASIDVALGNGWYKGRFTYESTPDSDPIYGDAWKLIAELHIVYVDGTEEVIGTDESWGVTRSSILFSNIYDGEVRDDTLEDTDSVPATLYSGDNLCPTERLSPPVTVREELSPVALLRTPAGETVLDMGQNFTGIFQLRVNEPLGTVVHLQFGEHMQEGNFYRDNLRSAKAEYIYTSDGNEHLLEPSFTFYGYRYVKVTGVTDLKKEDFTGLVLHTELSSGGTLATGNELINRLISNAEWSMKGNFLDVPTDCPQRDERMGWTGDAQVFAPTACFLRDTYAFYRKYLFDMAQEQNVCNGLVPNFIPAFNYKTTSSVWGDAACIMPWTLYEFYGDISILREQYGSMKDWVDYISRVDADKGWRNVFHFGDWLALDSPYIGLKYHGVENVRGGTEEGFIADVYYMNSAYLVAKAASLLGHTEDETVYSALSERIKQRIQDEYYSKNGRCCLNTQTALVLTLKHGLSDNTEWTRNALRELFKQSGNKLKTGFVGTPLLCNVLSEHGMTDISYNLLLNEEYPGWLYSVKLGATTIWERWNSVNPDGTMSSTGMNSLNHYAYGSIVEWLYRYAAGLNPIEPGFRRVRIAPRFDPRLGSLDMTYDSPMGRYRVAWETTDTSQFRLTVEVPFGCEAELVLPDESVTILEAGKYETVTAQ